MLESYFRFGSVLLLVAGASIAASAEQSSDTAPPEQEAATPLFPDGAGPSETEKDRRDGLSVGSFKLNGGLTLTHSFDDNIFATPTDRVSDQITTVSPFVTLRSDWSKHALNVDASAAFGRYHQYSSENFDDFSVGFDGRFDLGTRRNVFGGMRYSRRHESRDSPDAVNGTEPTVYDALEAHLGTFQQFDRVTLRLGGTFEDLNFQDVPATSGTINNDDRDRTVYETGTRLGYLVDRRFEPFVQTTANWRRYDEAQDDFGYKRSSHGVSAMAGLKFRLDGGVSGEAMAGYMHQSYEDGRFSDLSAPDFGGLLTWKPAPGTRLNLSVDRAIEETMVAGSSGYLNTETQVSLEQALTRSVTVGVSGSYAVADFQSVDRTDKTTALGAELRYFVLPNVFVGIEDRFLRRSSNVEDANFDENQVLLHVGGQVASGYRDGPDTITLDDLGLYAGLHLSQDQLGTKLEGPRGSGGTLDADFAGSGLGGGLFAGYGTSRNDWYLGFEVDGDWTTAGWDHARLPGGRTFDVTRGPSVAGTLRFGRWLPAGALLYARAGIAYTDFDTSYKTASGRQFDQSDGQLGPRVGAGVDVPLSERLFGRLDYSYTDYRDYEVAYTNNSDNFDNTELQARFGLGYRFQSRPRGNEDAEAPPPSYSGAYIGAQGGYGSLDTLNTGPRDSGSNLTADRGGHGASGGLFAGYGLTLGDFYLGAEIDGGYSDAGWTVARAPTGRVYSVDKDESIGASARVGYVLPYGTLAYGRVGVVRTRFNTKYANGGVSVDQDDALVGLRFGGGIETPLASDFFLRVDYTHTTYDAYNVNYGSGIDTFDTDENIGAIGVGYRF